MLLLLEEYVNIVTGETHQPTGPVEMVTVGSRDDFFTILDDFHNGNLTDTQKKAIQKEINKANKKL